VAEAGGVTDTGGGGAVAAADTIVSSFVPSFGQNLASSA
jgi:hypothetical protein